MSSVFADDAPIEARRQTLLREILDTLPVAFRIPMQGQMREMVNAMNEQQIAQASADIVEGKAAAQAGDMERLLNLARHWATDEQIREQMPMLHGMMQSGNG